MDGKVNSVKIWLSISVTILDEFLKLLVTNFHTKVTQVIGDFLKNTTFIVKRRG